MPSNDPHNPISFKPIQVTGFCRSPQETRRSSPTGSINSSASNAMHTPSRHLSEAEKLRKVVLELVDTERTYVKVCITSWCENTVEKSNNVHNILYRNPTASEQPTRTLFGTAETRDVPLQCRNPSAVRQYSGDIHVPTAVSSESGRSPGAGAGLPQVRTFQSV